MMGSRDWWSVAQQTNWISLLGGMMTNNYAGKSVAFPKQSGTWPGQRWGDRTDWQKGGKVLLFPPVQIKLQLCFYSTQTFHQQHGVKRGVAAATQSTGECSRSWWWRAHVLYVHVCTCTCVHMCMCVHVHMSMHMHAYVHVCIYVCVHACLHACVRACVCTCPYTCVCAMDVCVCTCVWECVGRASKPLPSSL